jgi:hypothetical protein
MSLFENAPGVRYKSVQEEASQKSPVPPQLQTRHPSEDFHMVPKETSL